MQLRSRWLAGLAAAALGLILSLVFLAQVLSFSEEETLWFVDPDDGQRYPAEAVSSVHFDLVSALAECAGFNRPTASIIQVYSQLADSNRLAEGKYSLCGRTLPTAPSSTEACGGQTLTRTWPRPDRAQESAGCFTSRYNTFAPFFHFAHDTPAELGALRAWAYGETTLRGYAAFAYGTDVVEPVVNATCTYTVPVEIDTGDVAAGSARAFGLYVHALADHVSQQTCLAQLAAAGKPWGAQTNDPRFPACATSSFLHDFGPSDADSDQTAQAVRAVYAALMERSLAREAETLYYPIPLTAHDGYLDRALDEFVHTWPTVDLNRQQDYPQERRQKAAEIKQWCAATRASDPAYARVRWFSFLPAVLKGLKLSTPTH